MLNFKYIVIFIGETGAPWTPGTMNNWIFCQTAYAIKTSVLSVTWSWYHILPHTLRCH